MEKKDLELLLAIPGGNEFIGAFTASFGKDSTFNIFISTEDIKDKLVEVMMFNGKSIAEFGKPFGRTDLYYMKDITEIKLSRLSVV